MSPARFEMIVPVFPGDIDAQDHVNNVVYLRWIQEVATAHWKAVASAKAQESTPVGTSGSGTKAAAFSDRFIPSRATQVVYNTRDEGLHFAEGSPQPVRRLRYQTQETCQWRNPSTGASLRVSYPSEEVVLIPVSGQ